MTTRILKRQWADELQQFTNRNAGRITRLEEHDPALGAQEEESGYPLRGIAYDRKDGRVEIMLGDLAGTDRHLTHTLSDVSRIDRLTDERGRDYALRIGREGRQTLLRFLG
jgi:hypothetical protein